MNKSKIEIKQVEPVLVVSTEGNGKAGDADKDIDRLYEYIYKNNLQDRINGSTIAIFYTEFGGKYEVAVPISEEILVEADIKIQTLPSIKCMSIVHEGSFETIEESFNLLKKYHKDHNLKWLFPVREIYNPRDGGGYNTEIQVPIE